MAMKWVRQMHSIGMTRYGEVWLELAASSPDTALSVCCVYFSSPVGIFDRSTCYFQKIDLRCYIFDFQEYPFDASKQH